MGVAGHVSSGQFAHGICIVFVFDANSLFERRIIEACDIASGEDVRVTGAKEFIHDDAGINSQADAAGKFIIRLDSQSSDHSGDLERFIAGGSHDEAALLALDRDHLLVRHERYTAVTVIVIQEFRQVGGEHVAADAGSAENHDNVNASRTKGSSQFRTDKTGADNGNLAAFVGEFFHPFVIGNGAIINDVLTTKGQAAWPATGSQEESIEGKDFAGGIPDLPTPELELGHFPAQVEIGLFGRGFSPDFIQVFVLPDAFGQRRAIIGGIVFGADNPNGAKVVDLADAFNGGVGAHAATDYQIFIVLHIISRIDPWFNHLPTIKRRTARRFEQWGV